MIWLLPWKDEDHSKHTPWAVYLLIILNVASFLVMWLSASNGETDWFDKYGLTANSWHWYQFITANFIHGGWFHLIGNMLFLWLIGDSIEDALGPVGFLLLYFLGGLAGDIWFISANADSGIPSVGASGCIATIAGACAVMFFSRPVSVRLMFFVFTLATFRMKAFWMLLLWFGMDVFRTFEGRGVMDAVEVNFVAHGAGFAFGFAVGFIALVHGVMRRYGALAEGHDWFGYWPEALESNVKRRRNAKSR
jgi:membrane associated rhomboid family serine protease